MAPRTAIEDYVKVIYGHTEWQSDPITPSGLAGRLGLAPSSVTEMVKKLAASGLVHHEPYGAIKLTADGTALALRMVRRHRLIETWLVRQFGYSWDEVHEEAEVLEHALSDRLIAAIDAQLGHPVRDPHGDPIPAADGGVVRPEAVQLGELAVGEAGLIVRISDRDAELLRTIEQLGIGLDEPVVRTADGAQTLGGVELPSAAAASVWVGRSA